ncbi:MAG: hypothetical protein M3Q19_14530 [Pseudomonadota bacterium]|nr:hypothetical protein [Pseudomonadota bacterium]
MVPHKGGLSGAGMTRSVDLDSLKRRLPAMKARLGTEPCPRERLGLLFRIALIEEVLRLD